MFLYSGTKPRAHMIRAGLSGVCERLLCPSLTSWSRGTGTTNKPVDVFSSRCSRHSELREKIEEKIMGVNWAESRHQISSTIWWELSVLCSCFNWKYTDIQWFRWSQFCCLVFMSCLCGEHLWDILFPSSGPKPTFQYRLHVVQWDSRV